MLARNSPGLRDRASWGHVIEFRLGDRLPRPPLRLVPLEAEPRPLSRGGACKPPQASCRLETGVPVGLGFVFFFSQPLSSLKKKPWHVFICFFN